MTEPRPRPQYGEYATPQAQAEAMGLPSPAHATPTVPMASTRHQEVRAVEPAHRREQTNLIVTVTLLALGLVNIGMSFSSYSQLGVTIQSVYDRLGYGTYTPGALAASLGVVAIAVSVVVWLATAAVSVLLIRKHRVSWWVPLAGAVLLFVAIAVIMTVAIVSDPSFTAYLDKLGR